MTPNELYKRTPEFVDKDINAFAGCYYNHIPEIPELENHYFELSQITARRIEFRYYKDFDFDGRRYWRLGAVTFNDEFVMIIQNAGREGDDYTGRFITNKDLYYKMVDYIKTLMPPKDPLSDDDIVNIDDDIPALDKFYGNELDGYFERY